MVWKEAENSKEQAKKKAEGGGKEHQSRRGYKMVRVGRGVKVARSAVANGAVSRKAGG